MGCVHVIQRRALARGTEGPREPSAGDSGM